MRTTRQQLLDLVRELTVGRTDHAFGATSKHAAQYAVEEIDKRLNALRKDMVEQNNIVDELIGDTAGMLSRVIDLELKAERQWDKLKMLDKAFVQLNQLDHEREAVKAEMKLAFDSIASRLKTKATDGQLVELEAKFAKRTAEDGREIKRLAGRIEIIDHVVKRLDAQRIVPESLIDGEVIGEAQLIKFNTGSDGSETRVHGNTKIVNMNALSSRTRTALTREGFVYVRDVLQFIANHDKDPQRLCEVPGLGESVAAEVEAVLL